MIQRILNWLGRTLFGSVLLAGAAVAGPLPEGFVYLRDVAPSIAQDMRYAGSHNFVGRRIDGYDAAECILTREAAQALASIQARLESAGFSLIVWDCYRPARAVADFKAWSTGTDQTMKPEFYPNTEKSRFFRDGYLASRSRHSSGSTVDLAIMLLADTARPAASPGELVSCLAPFGERYDDRTLDFGTGYDCLDPVASFDDPTITPEARKNRDALRQLMTAAGFVPYAKEWWHFELKPAPFTGRYFDFPVTAR